MIGWPWDPRFPVDKHPEPGESEPAFLTRLQRSVDHVTAEFAQPPQEVDRYACGKDTLFWDIEHCQG